LMFFVAFTTEVKHFSMFFSSFKVLIIIDSVGFIALP